MSDSKTSPINIPKKYTKSKFSFNEPPSDSSHYFFELDIDVNGIKKKFKKIEDKKYTNFIDIKDNIKYNELGLFEVKISKFPNTDFSPKILKDKIEQNNNSYSIKKNDIYIEFTKNDLGNTICNCYYAGIDFTQMFISPPN
jgi:hypothetical protein